MDPYGTWFIQVKILDHIPLRQPNMRPRLSWMRTRCPDLPIPCGMPRLLTDEEIDALLREPKALPPRWESRLTPHARSNERYDARQLDVEGEDGHKFRIIVRRAHLNQNDFSVILVFIDEDRTAYRLLRCNGKHPSQHTNRWEKHRGLSDSVIRNCFHIHDATERYQIDGLDIDGFATETSAYSSLPGAITEFIKRGGFVPHPDESSGFDSLFEKSGD